MYLPRRDELDPSEQRLLGLLEPMGLDFLTPRETYRQRFGQSRYYDWADVITLPPSTALTRSELVFHMYAEPALLPLPPEYLFADFMPFEDARENHRLIEEELRHTLGPPRTTDTSNTLGRSWRFGVFGVTLTTFPPELQTPARAGSNPLHERNPQLNLRASVTLKSDYAFAYPDDSLLGAAALLASEPSEHACALNVAADAKLHLSRRDARRNPSALRKLLSPEGLCGWHEESSTRIGLSAREHSLVFERAAYAALELVHLEPGRGPGGASLQLVPAATEAGTRTTSLLSSRSPSGLDRCAQQLAQLWQLELRQTEDYDA